MCITALKIKTTGDYYYCMVELRKERAARTRQRKKDESGQPESREDIGKEKLDINWRQVALQYLGGKKLGEWWVQIHAPGLQRFQLNQRRIWNAEIFKDVVDKRVPVFEIIYPNL